jgi:molybdenum cofactor biosynthesis protein B
MTGDHTDRETDRPDSDTTHADPGGHDQDGSHQPNHDHSHHGHGQSDHDHAGDAETVTVSVLSISSSRDRTEDVSGERARQRVEAAGHDVIAYDVVADDADAIREHVTSSAADVVVTTGGTGITPDDVTVEAIRSVIDKELPGVGERFRSLSYDDIGDRAMLSRAVAGTVDRTLVFALPGSPAAVELGLEKAVLPIVGHGVALLEE